MKFQTVIIAGMLALALPACSSYDDSKILERLDALEQKVEALQKDVDSMNGSIAALGRTIEALSDNETVTALRTIFENGRSGLEVTYSKSGTVKIFFDKSGLAPQIAAKEVNGVQYWTVDGEFLLDASGKRIPVTGPAGADGKPGVTPQLKIEDGWWKVSVDGGKTWEKIAEAASSAGGSSVFRSASVVDGNLVVVLTDGTRITIPVTSIEKPSSFDEDNIVLSLGAISDTHIGYSAYDADAKFSSALNQLKNRAAEKDADGLDAVMVVGDLVNNANSSQISTFKSRYEQVFDPVKVPMIYTVGNHDMNPNYNWTASTVTQNATFHNILGDNYFLTDQDQTMRHNFECRHCVVGDYHILCITPNGTSPVVYDANSSMWLDSQLKAITEADPGRYVILLTHPMIYNTVYGSLLGTYWYTDDLTSILEKYPQVVTFGGHLHFPLNDPRSVWQGKFTSFGCASVAYMAFEGGNYIGKKSNTVLSDAGEYSEGLLIQFDVNGYMRATRMDFYRSTVIGKPWIIAPPASDGSHLGTYDHVALKAANTAPALSDMTFDIGELSGGKASVTAKWAAGTDDEFVHHYSYTLRMEGSVLDSKLIMSDFYRTPQPSMMKKEYSLDLGSLAEGTYTFEVTAIDSWDAASAPLVKDFTVGTGSKAIWTADAAGSTSFEGGAGSVSDGWLSYSGGTISWTANTSGKPRRGELTLPDGTLLKVSQLEASDFKGTWSFRTQRFSNNTAVTTTVPDVTFDISIGDPLYGETLKDVGGATYTNNLGVRGLYLDAVADAVLAIDYATRSARFGLFLDERKAQAVSNGVPDYPYVCFIPELGGSADTVTGSYTFVPVPVGTDNNYTWLWFDISSDFNTLNYDHPFQKLNTVNSYSSSPYIIGITCAVCSGAAPEASGINGTYNVIYQANPDKKNDTGGFTLTRK